MWEDDGNGNDRLANTTALVGRQRLRVGEVSGQKHKKQAFCTVSKFLSMRELLITRGNSNLSVKKPVSYHRTQMIDANATNNKTR